MMPGGYVQPPYDELLSSTGRDNDLHRQQQHSLSQARYDPQKTSTTFFGLKPPTDDSPFYFAKEQIPKQLILLIEMVLGVSAVLALLLIYYSKANKIRLTASSRFHLSFVVLIGLGFMFIEITFIQKFLLLLGTPIMALTVILFSILLSSGIGAYLSGRLFNKSPYKAIVISIPFLAGVLLAYFGYLQTIVDSSITREIHERIVLTFGLLFPAGLLMGFQFPSITKMASYMSSSESNKSSDYDSRNQDIT